jgi:hypothetical protein
LCREDEAGLFLVNAKPLEIVLAILVIAFNSCAVSEFLLDEYDAFLLVLMMSS